MNRTSVCLLVLAAAAFAPVSAPAQDAELDERMEEVRRRRQERRRLRTEQNVAQAGAPQAGAAQAGAATRAGQGGAPALPIAGAAGRAQGGVAGVPAQGGSGGILKKDPIAEPLLGVEALRASRPERRRATVDRLRERWGPLLGEVRAREELRLHAQRVAHLQRIRSLAEEKKKLKTIEQVDALITKEELRHAKTMNSFRDGAPPAPPTP